MLTDSLNTRTFSWTADSRLASLSATTGNESYTYSAFGTRAKVGTRTFLRAGAGVTASALDDGNADYTPGVSEMRGGNTTFMHSGLKHMAAQTDAPSSGSTSVQATRTYDAFGGVAASAGTWQGPFGTAGAFGYQTEASALHLLGHRYYDASLGRFLTRDPIGDGSNWYSYCGSNPVSYYDHEGEIRWDVVANFIMILIDFVSGPVPGVVDGDETLPGPGSPPPGTTISRPIDPKIPPRPRGPGRLGGGGGSGAAMGAIATVAVGAGAAAEGLRHVILHRRRIEAHEDAWSDDSKSGDEWEGIED